MSSMSNLLFAAASAAALVSAQGTCGQDLLVDDFSAIRRKSIVFDSILE
jgi:hypothetical protein